MKTKKTTNNTHLSYWERNTFLGESDAIIIGSGLVGLNAALHLKTLRPNWKILVLESGTLPSGASTKNAGFACFGSPSELLDDLQTQSAQEVFEVVEMRWRGLRNLRQRLGDAAIDLQPNGGHELFSAAQVPLHQSCLEALPFLNAELQKINGLTQNYLSTTSDRFGFRGLERQIKIVAEAQLDTGKMMARLLDLVAEAGIRVLNGVRVTAFEDGGAVRLETDKGWELQTQKLIVATNGFARQLLPSLDVQPARNQVLITKPIKGLAMTGTFHLEMGYYYFRNVGARLLLGGGRHLAREAEATDDFGTTAIIQQNLLQLLAEHILPTQNFEVEQWWSGILGIGNTKKPIVQAYSDNVTVAVRLGGMGVAIGSLVGEAAAACCLQV